jgi:hypothetical protein
VSTTVAGYAQAWMSKKMGDLTPEQLGFLSLDPLEHIDPIGAFCLLFLGIGWGKFMPNDITFLNSWQILTIFLTPSLVYVAIGLLALLLLLALFGSSVVHLSLLMINVEYTQLSAFSKLYSSSSSADLTIGFLLFMFLYVGVMFAALNVILNGCRFIATVILKKHGTPTNDLLFLLFSFIAMIFLAQPIRIFLTFIIARVAYACIFLCGM